MKYKLVERSFDEKGNCQSWSIDNSETSVAEFYDEQLAIKVLEFLNNQSN